LSTLKVNTIQHSNGTDALTIDSAGNTSFSGVVTGTPLGNRNLIINGDMRIAQRGTSATGLTNGNTGYHTVDRWKFQHTGTITYAVTMSQDTDVPSGEGFSNSVKYDITTAQSSLAAGDSLLFSHYFEGQMLQHLKKGTTNAESVTLSFWVKSNKTGTYIAELLDADNSRAISKSYTIDSADTWEKKSLTFAGDTTGAFVNDNNTSLALIWWLGAGTDFTSGTLQTSWGTIVNSNRAVGVANLADSTSNYINITGVQLEVGDTATEFEHRPYDMELQRCERYYRKYILGDGTGSEVGITGFNNTTGEFQGHFHFRTEMRAKPAFDYDGALSSYRVTYAGGGSTNPTVIQQIEQNTWGSGIRVYISGLTAGQASVFRALSTGTGAINYDAEL